MSAIRYDFQIEPSGGPDAAGRLHGPAHPGLFLPVLTIRGVLTRDGIAQVAPVMLEKGLSDETIAVLKSMMNPSILGFLNATGGDLRKIILEKLTPQVTAALQKGVDEVEVYTQTRSIVSAVRRLYEVGSPVPATLILLFSVIVPFGKAALVAWATFVTDGERRRRTLKFVEAIAKWSMADVFVVAIFIAYLAAKASTALQALPHRSWPSARTSAPASTGSPPTASSRWHRSRSACDWRAARAAPARSRRGRTRSRKVTTR